MLYLHLEQLLQEEDDLSTEEKVVVLFVLTWGWCSCPLSIDKPSWL